MTDINLDSIPHPRDCRRVPVGAVIPMLTPRWRVTGDQELVWMPNGDFSSRTVREDSLPVLVAEPIGSSRQMPGGRDVGMVDLDSVPHPRDCHRVPVGGRVPKRTPRWVVNNNWELVWMPEGADADRVVRDHSVMVFTVEPIGSNRPGPRPDDSPIIASGACDGVAFRDELLVANGGSWVGTGIRVSGGSSITEWTPALAARTGSGVMDDRDKRPRLDEDGVMWVWVEWSQSWTNHDPGFNDCGSLAALAVAHGPLTFAGGAR